MEVEVQMDPKLEQIRVVIHAPAMTPEVTQLAERLSGESPGFLPGFRGGEVTLLALEKILRFYGEDKEIRAQTAAGIYTVRLRLYELEQRLTGRRFARITHSEIVNLDQVEALDLALTGTIRVRLHGGVTTYVSRRYVRKIKEVLGI